MSEMKFELRQPRTPLSRNMRERGGLPESTIAAVERLEAINAKLLAALEELIAWEGPTFPKEPRTAWDRVIAQAREAIAEAKGEA